MSTSIFLAQLLGLYLAIVGISILLKAKELHATHDLLKNKPLAHALGMLVLLIGLMLVLAHNIWVKSWPVIITIIGWAVLLKAIAFLLLPHGMFKSMAKSCGKKSCYVLGGVIYLILGLILAGKGFGVI